MRILAVLFSLLFLMPDSMAQEFYTVIAENGLTIRTEPSKDAEVVGKFEMGEDIPVFERGDKVIEVIDGDQVILGNWIRAGEEEGHRGYVFSGYLIEKATDPNIYVKCDSPAVCHSTYIFEDFDVPFYNYQSYTTTDSEKDTVYVSEDVFNNLNDKLLQIIQKKEIDSIKLYYAFSEYIYEERAYEQEYPENYEELTWRGQGPFTEIYGDGAFFRMPVFPYSERYMFTKNALALRDTSVYVGGDWDVVAKLVYKDKPCNYIIENIILKVVLFYKEKKEEKYIDILLSYGC